MGNDSDDLTAAMAQYIPAPRPGIEQRVLRHVRTAQKRRRRYWTLIPVLPLLVLLLLLLLMLWPRPVPVVVRVTPTRTLPLVGQAVPPAHKRHHREKVQPFPTPAPLTEEEKALQALAASRPQEAQQLLAHEDDKPIEIPQLQIPPLQSDGGR